jgi:3-hydroxybutyryl-CoA dehydratase
MTVEEIRKGQRISHSFRISATDMDTFAMLSGDHNPVHSDVAFAAACGFDKPIVYGGLLVAQISRLIGMDLPARNGIWYSLRLDFRGPLYVGEEARLIAEVGDISSSVGLLTLAIRIESSASLVACGTVEVVMAGTKVMGLSP